MSLLNKVAAEIISKTPPKAQQQSLLSRTAMTVRSNMKRVAFVDRDAEWQRVHSYIADALKDMHVLYAKLARLEGDFSGTELEEIDAISESVLDLGEKMSKFSREFSQGNIRMMESPTFHGGDGGGGGGGGGGMQAPPAPPALEGGAPEGGAPAGEPKGEKVPVMLEEEGGEAGGGPEEWAPEEEEAPPEEEEEEAPKKKKSEEEE